MNRYLALYRCLETGRRHPHFVVSGQECERLEFAGAVSSRRETDTSGLVGDRYGCVGHDAPRLVAHGAHNGPTISLGEGGARKGEQENQGQGHSSEDHLGSNLLRHGSSPLLLLTRVSQQSV